MKAISQMNFNFPVISYSQINRRLNALDIDFPIENNNITPASEPETKIIVDLMNKYNFKKVIAIHTNHFIKFPNPPMINYDGEQSRELAEKISHITGLIAHQDIGYPTPGSMGIWVGKDLKKISVTIELDDTKKSDEHYKKHGGVFSVSILS